MKRGYVSCNRIVSIFAVVLSTATLCVLNGCEKQIHEVKYAAAKSQLSHSMNSAGESFDE